MILVQQTLHHGTLMILPLFMFGVDYFTKYWQFFEVVFKVFPWYSVNKKEL
jgi:hypothetical protein